MKTFRLRISSPDGDLYNGDAVKIVLRGAEGDLAILAGHIPFATSVMPCECRVELPDGTEKKGKTEGGILTAGADCVTLLSSTFSW